MNQDRNCVECSSASVIIDELKALGDSRIASHSQRFFKTGKGEYGEGDVFLGIRVPVIRKCVRKHKAVLIPDILILLRSPYHEVRLFAVLSLVVKYASTDDADIQTLIFKSYLSHTEYINNWDIVDSSAPQIVGAYLFSREKKPIYDLAYSTNLWERRIAVISTFYFIRRNEYKETLAISEILLFDDEDLIHKAVGWMLREIGNRDRTTEEEFLLKHYKKMPRTMLRYAIEKFPEELRLSYLHGTR